MPKRKNNTILNSIILKDLLGLMLATKVVLTNLSFIANRRLMVSMRTLVDLKTCLVVLGKALVAVTISILTILLFLFKINAEPWFNTNDLSHLVMIGCMFIFAKGFEQMKINIVSA